MGVTRENLGLNVVTFLASTRKYYKYLHVKLGTMITCIGHMSYTCNKVKANKKGHVEIYSENGHLEYME